MLSITRIDQYDQTVQKQDNTESRDYESEPAGRGGIHGGAVF